MRILYLCTDPGIPFWGTKGASIHVREFTDALVDAGHQVTVVMARAGRKPAGAGFAPPLIEIPSENDSFYKPAEGASLSEAALLYEARQFAQNRPTQDVINDLLAREPYDVICERYSLFSIGGREAARWHSIPYVLEVNAPLVEEARTHRQLVMEPLARTVARYVFSTADRVFPVSAPLGDYIRSIAPDAKVSVFPNGVDLKRFGALTEGATWRTMWNGGNPGDFFVGFIGSLKPWHGVDILLESFRALRRDLPGCRLVYVGNGPERTAIENTVREAGLDADVILTGALDHADIPQVMMAMDVLVAPYPDLKDFYFSPLKVYEYMAAGRPIVASQIGQISDILIDGETGLLVPPGDAAALTRALRRVHDDTGLRNRLAQGAQKTAQLEHGWDRRVRHWEAQVTGVLQPAKTMEASR